MTGFHSMMYTALEYGATAKSISLPRSISSSISSWYPLVIAARTDASAAIIPAFPSTPSSPSISQLTTRDSVLTSMSLSLRCTGLLQFHTDISSLITGAYVNPSYS